MTHLTSTYAIMDVAKFKDGRVRTEVDFDSTRFVVLLMSTNNVHFPGKIRKY